MIEQHYLQQLQKSYGRYLKGLIEGSIFETIILRGGKSKPASTKELESGVQSFLRYQKEPGKPGWDINWERWQSKKLGSQQWPASVSVSTEADLIHLLGKEAEVAAFRFVLQRLAQWNAGILSWLQAKPKRVLDLKEQWEGICSVIDYLLRVEVSGKYIRCLPVPVHTKFIQENSAVILSILKHVSPERFSKEMNDLEEALGLQKKPVLCMLRWLDDSLAEKYASGLEIFGAASIALRSIPWEINEIWVVENETNLYLLPKRNAALGIFGRGYALHELKAIPMLQRSRLFYWGDLDEHGFHMLHQFRQLYPHAESVLMDEATVRRHEVEIRRVAVRLHDTELNLISEERKALELLQGSGRIEQEQIKQDWMVERISEIGSLRY